MADPIVLAKRMDGAAAVDLAAQLAKTPPGSDCVVDASDVTHIGVLAVQVLLSANQSAASGGGTFDIVNLGDRALGHISALGLSLSDLTTGAPA